MTDLQKSAEKSMMTTGRGSIKEMKSPVEKQLKIANVELNKSKLEIERLNK